MKRHETVKQAYEDSYPNETEKAYHVIRAALGPNQYAYVMAYLDHMYADAKVRYRPAMCCRCHAELVVSRRKLEIDSQPLPLVNHPDVNECAVEGCDSIAIPGSGQGGVCRSHVSGGSDMPCLPVDLTPYIDPATQ